MRDDEQSLRGLETRLELPAGLEIEWLGVSGYRIAYAGQTLYVDPFVSRVPLSYLLRRQTTLPDPDQIERHFPAGESVAGVLVGHTHWDHAVDAPALARRCGCMAYGSRSLGALMRLHGLGDRVVEVEPYRTYELGPFEATFVPSAHSKLVLGVRVPFAGDLTCEHLDGLSPSAYRCGQVWGIHIVVAGVTFYHQGSVEQMDEGARHRWMASFHTG